MWRDLTRLLATFDGAVVTWRGANGYPASVRCHPVPSEDRRALAIRLPPGLGPQPGPAGLLCHAHDANLFNLRSFHVNGQLRQEGASWWFVPERLIPGLGIGVRGQVRSVINPIVAASRYLRLRNLKAPAIDWAEIDAAKHEGAALFDAARRPRR
jgi:hypothetical protein